MTTLYRIADSTSTALPPEAVVTVKGQTWSAEAASRVFSPKELADAALLLEHREQNLGDGYEDPVIGHDADGCFCIWVRAVVMTPERELYRATLAIMVEAEDMQIAAVQPYAWPEAAAWVALESQARAYLADPAAPVGLDLAADCGPYADPDEMAYRAARIISNADTLRHTAGQIKRWRRACITTLEDCAAQGGTPANIAALLAVMLEQGVTWAEPEPEPTPDIDQPPPAPDPDLPEAEPEPDPGLPGFPPDA